jgi:Peptidase family M20/M25/M40
MQKTSLLVLVSLLTLTHSLAQSALTQQVRAYRKAHEHQLLGEFMGLLSIPNVVYDTVGIQKTAAYIATMMTRRGIKPQLLAGKTPGVPPALYGEVLVPGATKTITFYAHYDGQPVNPNQWAEGIKPFEAVLLDRPIDAGGKIIPFPKPTDPFDPNWRMYGRSTSDDKAGVFAILSAYQTLTALGIRPSVNLKFFFEGEEEAGSTHLAEILDKHKDKLTSDLWIICDGPVHQSGRKQVVFGVTGAEGDRPCGGAGVLRDPEREHHRCRAAAVSAHRPRDGQRRLQRPAHPHGPAHRPDRDPGRTIDGSRAGGAVAEFGRQFAPVRVPKIPQHAHRHRPDCQPRQQPTR